ncbi:gamma-glutamyltransferase [Austwickia sp. TVS 96-490-7B]|uniref:gamma-glutamyltransferase n=1 Tax=Austwickia sp. TVS 96-490-7B TaxID=2830843 RepID=UPI00351CF7B1
MTTVAVAAPGSDAVAAAAAVVDLGGNAVDAAVAAMVVATCTEPGIVSPMGGAFVNVWPPGGDAVVIDGNCEMPGRGRSRWQRGDGTRAVSMDYSGGITVWGGAGSVATPGMFLALSQAAQQWGVVPWAELMAPAAHVVRRGYRLGATSAYYLGFAVQELFAEDPDLVSFLAQAGDPPTAGCLLRDPDLAEALDRVGREGAQDLYTGELGTALAQVVQDGGGLLGREDLAAYRTVTRPALSSQLGRWDLAVNPAPSVGGPVLTAMVRLLQRRHQEHGVVDAADLVDIQRQVLAYRRRRVDVAEDLERAGRELLDMIDAAGGSGNLVLSSSPDTVHVSTVDATGLACAITASAGYGAGVTVPGTGLALNNALGEPELNRRGMHALPAGTRLASNMAPTTARRDDGTVLAIGSPGADRITTALFQVLSGVCLDELPVQAAVDRPRLHVHVDEAGAQLVRYERCPELAETVRGLTIPTEDLDPLTMYFGGVGAALCRPDGTVTAAGDPRRAAATGVRSRG